MFYLLNCGLGAGRYWLLFISCCRFSSYLVWFALLALQEGILLISQWVLLVPQYIIFLQHLNSEPCLHTCDWIFQTARSFLEWSHGFSSARISHLDPNTISGSSIGIFSSFVSLALSILESLTATLTKAALVKASVNFGACWFSGQNREWIVSTEGHLDFRSVLLLLLYLSHFCLWSDITAASAHLSSAAAVD